MNTFIYQSSSLLSQDEHSLPQSDRKGTRSIQSPVKTKNPRFGVSRFLPATTDVPLSLKQPRTQPVLQESPAISKSSGGYLQVRLKEPIFKGSAQILSSRLALTAPAWHTACLGCLAFLDCFMGGPSLALMHSL